MPKKFRKNDTLKYVIEYTQELQFVDSLKIAHVKDNFPMSF